MSEQPEEDLSPHAAWMREWEQRYVTDEDALEDLFDRVVLSKVRLTTKRGSSSDHPDETVVIEGVVVGQGTDIIVSLDDKDYRLGRLSLVLDNGHAYHMKPGMTVEVWEEDRPGRNAHYTEVASFPPLDA